MECRPVEISNGAFSFCKYTIALLLWASLLMQSKIMLLLCFIILMLSVLLKVKNAPLVFLYSSTLDKFLPSGRVVIDENAVRFAHIVGSIFSGAALIFLYFIHPLTGWVITLILAILKTSGALGFCGAMKIYGCLNNPNGTCCRVGKKVKKYQCGKG